MKLIISDVKDMDAGLPDCQVIEPHGEIRPCIGCFGCWVKTPGRCVLEDGYENTGAAMAKADELIYVSECVYGGFSPFVKRVQDRGISYVSPYFEVQDGKMRHKRRYDNSLTVSAHLYGENLTQAEMDTARELIAANARNLDASVGEVRFYSRPEEIVL